MLKWTILQLFLETAPLSLLRHAGDYGGHILDFIPRVPEVMEKIWAGIHKDSKYILKSKILLKLCNSYLTPVKIS